MHGSPQTFLPHMPANKRGGGGGPPWGVSMELAEKRKKTLKGIFFCYSVCIFVILETLKISIFPGENHYFKGFR